MQWEPLPVSDARDPMSERSDKVKDAYSDEVEANVRFFGDRARELADQEVERARALDTKAGALVAGCVALLGASVVFATRLSEIPGGQGAKSLWAAELVAVLLALFGAGGLAAWAFAPKAFRAEIHIDELLTWPTPEALDRGPVYNQGVLLHGSVVSIGHARVANHDKAKRLAWAFAVFAAALASIVLLAASLAIHAATSSADDRSPGRAFPAPHDRVGSGANAPGAAGPYGTTVPRAKARP